MKTKAQAYLDLALKLPIEIKSVKDRLDRAGQQVLNHGYEVRHIQNGTYRVSKASTSLLEDHSQIYLCSNASCTCPDFQSAYGNLCKHRLAVMILEEMEKI